MLQISVFGTLTGSSEKSLRKELPVVSFLLGVIRILPDTASASLTEATNMCPGRLKSYFEKVLTR